MPEITKHLQIAVNDAQARRITVRQLHAILQEAIENGDILLPDNWFVVTGVVMPLLDTGHLRHSKYVSELKRLMSGKSKHLETAVNDRDAGRITTGQMLSIFQEAIDNGDILLPDNQFVVVAAVLPLLDGGGLRRSEHVSEFEQRMDNIVKDRLDEMRRQKGQ
jgi:hypothetical protein